MERLREARCDSEKRHVFSFVSDVVLPVCGRASLVNISNSGPKLTPEYVSVWYLADDGDQTIIEKQAKTLSVVFLG